MNQNEEFVCLLMLVGCMFFSFVMPVLILPTVIVVLFMIIDDYNHNSKK